MRKGSGLCATGTKIFTPFRVQVCARKIAAAGRVYHEHAKGGARLSRVSGYCYSFWQCCNSALSSNYYYYYCAVFLFLLLLLFLLALLLLLKLLFVVFLFLLIIDVIITIVIFL
jgi:hypothetical protein